MPGFIVNSITMWVYLPVTQSVHIISLCLQLIQAQTCTIQHIDMAISVLILSFPAVPLGEMHHRQMWNHNAVCKINFKWVRELTLWY